jgi:hypothetical protein
VKDCRVAGKLLVKTSKVKPAWSNDCLTEGNTLSGFPLPAFTFTNKAKCLIKK